jgi:CHAT domain-containing protein
LLWKNILPYLKGINTIYFSATDLLHTIPIEHLPYQGKIMSDLFNMIRLSSTREILFLDSESYPYSASLYGGIHFDVDTTKMIKESLVYRSINNDNEWHRDTLYRGEVYFLPGTKKEVEDINQILQKNNLKSTLYMYTSANEESFKALTGRNENIIHLSTHGFLWTDEAAHNQNYFNQYKFFKRNFSVAPLSRCGLLLAGANIALTGHSHDLPKNIQDGILTAQEISLLNLSNCNLVVLSACETARGDITSDGVYGLQRAFKIAGVQTILMSLWKIDDTATQILITEFYKNWIEKKLSKREALKNAQDVLRSNEKYKDPKYWAGFIMLD